MTDGPTFCWWCGGQLDLRGFAEVKDPIGHVHRVHKVCTDDAIEDNTPLTAQPPEQHE